MNCLREELRHKGCADSMVMRDYIEETIRIWLANMELELELCDLRVRRPRYFDKTIAEMKRRGICVDKRRRGR